MRWLRKRLRTRLYALKLIIYDTLKILCAGLSQDGNRF